VHWDRTYRHIHAAMVVRLQKGSESQELVLEGEEK